MGSLTVVIRQGADGRFSQVCRDSLVNFTPELEQIIEMPDDTHPGGVWTRIGTPFVAFLDETVAVCPGWADRMMASLLRSAAAAIGPLTNGADGAQHQSGDYQDIPGFLDFADRIAQDRAGQIRSVEALDPCCVIYSRDRLTGIGLDAAPIDLPASVHDAGLCLALALDTYVHSFASYYAQARPEVVAMIPETASRILDVGCGTGTLGGRLKTERRIEVIGVEMDPVAAEAAGRVLDRVHRGDIETLVLPYPAGSFDAIITADILEHLRDPWGLLTRLSPLLSPEGRLIACLPNVRHWSVVRGLLEGEWTYLPAGILDRTHLRFFTRRSGQALIESAGLCVIRTEPIRSAGPPDLATLVEACRGLLLDASTLVDEASVAQYLYLAAPRR